MRNDGRRERLGWRGLWWLVLSSVEGELPVSLFLLAQTCLVCRQGGAGAGGSGNAAVIINFRY